MSIARLNDNARKILADARSKEDYWKSRGYINCGINPSNGAIETLILFLDILDEYGILVEPFFYADGEVSVEVDATQWTIKASSFEQGEILLHVAALPLRSEWNLYCPPGEFDGSNIPMYFGDPISAISLCIMSED